MWELYPATDRLIKSFIIYLLPLFVITSKTEKIQRQTERNTRRKKMISLKFKQQVQKYMKISKIRCTKTKQMQRKETIQTQSKMALALTRSWPASLEPHCCVLLAS